MRFACPHCDAHLQAEPALAGKTIKCPACAGKLTIPAEMEATGPTGTVEAPPQGAEGAAGAPAEGAAPMPEDTGALTSGGAKWTDYSNVSMLISGGIALLIWVIAYVILKLTPKDAYINELMLQRGWVQGVTGFLTAWAIGILILKFLKIRKQRGAMLLEILPYDMSEEINPDNLPEFHQHVVNLPERVRDSFMVNRVRRALEYFWVRRNNPEVASMMSSQSDIDSNAIAGSYSIIKVFIWAIPIMGFIGTVLGIGAAIGSFADALNAAEDPEALMASLTKVTGGLGVAFDTTLLALVLSLLVSFPASTMQKAEEDLLNQVDDYCNENLLKRLNDGGAGAGMSGDSAGLVQKLGDAINRNQKEMMDKFRLIHENTANAQAEQISAFKEASTQIRTQAEEMDERAKRHQSLIEEDFTRLIDGVQKDALKSINALGDGIAGLNSVLKDLGEKQVVIQKKSWFSRK